MDRSRAIAEKERFSLSYPSRSSETGFARHGDVVVVVVALGRRPRRLQRRRRGRRRRRVLPLLLRELQVLLRREPLPVEQLVLRHAHVARAAVVVLVRAPFEFGFSGRAWQRPVAVRNEVIAEFVGRLRVWHDGQLLEVPLKRRVAER